MSDQPAIGAFFARDHDRLDTLFASYQSLKRPDFHKAKEAFEEFMLGLRRHIVWEEDLVFPLWEEQTGMSEGGPTFVMRAEHRQIGEQLEAIHRKVAEQNPDTEREEQALSAILRSHNLKEERVLYPAIDQVTAPEQRSAVYRNMQQIPEDRYRVGRGVHQG